MPARPPSLRAVAAFEAAARHENFSRAAAELNLTPGAVSHAIRGLEDQIGAQLFKRVGRTVVLTEAGARLAQRVGLSLTLLSDALGERSAERGRLTLGGPPGLIPRLLGPHLAQFRTASPETALALREIAGPAALLRGEADVALLAGPVSGEGFCTRSLGEDVLYPAGASAFASWRDARALPGRVLIESREHPWSLWAGRPAAAPGEPPAMSVDTDLMALELAAAGAGVCLAPHRLVARDLARGTLVRIGDAGAIAGPSYQLVWAAASARQREIGQLARWLDEALPAAAPPVALARWPTAGRRAALAG